MSRDYTVQSVVRALNILQTFTAQRPQRGLADIAAGVGLTRSSCHRLLSTLERAGFVTQSSRGSYSLGIAAAQVGSIAIRELSPPEPVLDLLRRLAAETGETIGMSILDGHEALLIGRAESPLPLRMLNGIGDRQPAYVTASGRVLLAHCEHLDQLLAEIRLEPYTPRTITDRGQLRAFMSQIRRDGYAIDREEVYVGLSCLAAPVRDDQGRASAAIAISGPSVRLRLDKHLDRLLAILHRYIADIEASLYYANQHDPDRAERV